MDQFKRLWSSLSIAQRISIGLAIVGLASGLTWLSSWKHESGFKPLFRNMASTDAAEAVQKLKESGVEYRLADDGGTILVPQERMDETRLILARAGLPKSGRLGFELFDNQTFGTTDFTEQVNYRRALEGELERTISTISEVERARVHLTFAKDSVFTESRESAKASVLLNLKRSTALTEGSVVAIANLVAGAVEGLTPNQITIVDAEGTLLNKPRSPGSTIGSAPGDQLEYRAAVERDLQNKLTQTLDPVLGSGKYRAGVSVDVDFSNVQESEEKWDPNNSVMVASQRTEESNTSQAGAGIPGTQANLPDGAPRSSGSNGVTRKTENTTYETSRTVRHVDQQKGAVKRITVAVLLDQEGKWQGKGAAANLVLTPPPPETIQVIKGLVTNVAGLNMERGDQITVDTLPFSSTKHLEPPEVAAPAAPKPSTPPAALMDQIKDPKILGAIGGGAVVLLAAVFFLVKKMSGKKKNADIANALPAGAPGAAIGTGALPVTETLSPDDLARLEQGLLESLRVQPKTISKSDTLAKYLRQEVRQNPQVAAQMLRTWLLEEGHSS